MKLGATGLFQETNYEITEASYHYVVALEITKQKRPHTISETFKNVCIKIVLGN